MAAIAEDTWRHQLDEEIFPRMREGLPIERLPDLSPEQAERDAAWGRALRERLARIDPPARAALSHEDELTVAIHDATLSSGSLPPTVLARHVDWWIEQEKQRR